MILWQSESQTSKKMNSGITDGNKPIKRKHIQTADFNEKPQVGYPAMEAEGRGLKSLHTNEPMLLEFLPLWSLQPRICLFTAI